MLVTTCLNGDSNISFRNYCLMSKYFISVCGQTYAKKCTFDQLTTSNPTDDKLQSL